jgi:DNA mismatch repair ATPase MutS
VKQARHPCLEVQDDINFIANDHVMLKGKWSGDLMNIPLTRLQAPASSRF